MPSFDEKLRSLIGDLVIRNLALDDQNARLIERINELTPKEETTKTTPKKAK